MLDILSAFYLFTTISLLGTLLLFMGAAQIRGQEQECRQEIQLARSKQPIRIQSDYQ